MIVSPIQSAMARGVKSAGNPFVMQAKQNIFVSKHFLPSPASQNHMKHSLTFHYCFLSWSVSWSSDGKPTVHSDSIFTIPTVCINVGILNIFQFLFFNVIVSWNSYSSLPNMVLFNSSNIWHALFQKAFVLSLSVSLPIILCSQSFLLTVLLT